MKYCIERICPTGEVSEEFGDYSDEKEANRNAELLNIVDPFNNYKVKKKILSTFLHILHTLY